MRPLVFLVLLMLTLGSKSFSSLSSTTGGGRRTRVDLASTAKKMEELQVLTGIRDIVDRYDTFLLDMWGVMHDGTTTYEGVLEVVQKLKEQGKDLIILSNSSKRQDNSIKMLKKLQFDPDRDFSQIITSGEVTYHLLSQTLPDASPLAPKPWEILEPVWNKKREAEKCVFCFGSGDGDQEYLESCGWTLSSMERADLIVARGTFTINDGSTVVHKTHDGEEAYFEAYHEQLAKAAARKIPLIVANPDKIRPDADRSPMPGTIGNDYERILKEINTSFDAADRIKYIGKPFSDVYEIALRGKDRARVCMIGDALETDVTGGSAMGIDTIWVINDGIHNVEVENKGNGSLQEGCSSILAEFNAIPETYAKGRQLIPSMVVPHFRW